MSDSVRRAIERIEVQDWAGASQALTALQATEDERVRAATDIRHDIANAVAIVQANVEGMLDGVLEPTHERLEAVHEALTGITTMLDRWRRLRV